MIVMTPEATDAEIAAVRDRLETTGVHVLVLPGELVTAIGAIGDPEGVRELGLEGMAGVDRVVPISRPYKLASSELAHHEPTVFAVDGHSIGAPATFALIAALDHVAVVISDKGRRHRAYGLYQGDTVARDDHSDRIVIFRDTLLRDFGDDPDELRAQVTRTVRHELAHHLGADELGVRELGL